MDANRTRREHYGPLVVSAATPQYLNRDFGNNRDVGYLKITKHLTGGPGAPTYDPNYTIHYVCGAASGDVTLKAGASTTVGPYTVGTVCTVTEPTKPTPPTDYTFGTVTFTDSSGTANDGVATIVKSTQATAVEVTVNNSLTSTAGDNVLKLAKSLTGGPEATPDRSRSTTTARGGFDGHVTSRRQSRPSQVSRPGRYVPSRRTCRRPPGYSFGIPTFTENSGTANDGEVTIVGSATVTVTTNNTLSRDTGLPEDQEELRPADGSGFAGDFTIHSMDGPTLGNVSSPAVPRRRSVPTGTSARSPSPHAERPDGWTFGTPVSTVSGPATIVKGDHTTWTVTNSISRDKGSLKMKKKFDADAPGSLGDFTIHVDCTQHFGNVRLAGGARARHRDPDRDQCTVTEPDAERPDRVDLRHPGLGR